MNNAEMNIPAISTTAGVSFSVAALNAASDANRMVQVWPPTSTVILRVKAGVSAGATAFIEGTRRYMRLLTSMWAPS